jgi:hypothetical protein
MQNKAHSFLFYLCLCVLPLGSGCNLFGIEELEPSFLFIDNFSVISDPETEGAPTSKIPDAWVYVNGIALGVFEVPVTIPILDTGLVTISIFPGIKENGFSTVGNIYPFYRAYELDLELHAFETDSIIPALTYLTDLDYIFLERFELGNDFNELSGSDTGLLITTDPDLVLEGNRSAFTVLEGDNSSVKVGTGPMTFPAIGETVWAEVDYRCNMQFDVWVNGNYTGGVPISSYMLSVPSRLEWNKIYLNLGPKVQELQAETYNLQFRAVKSDTLDIGWIYFDNIKIIAF